MLPHKCNLWSNFSKENQNEKRSYAMNMKIKLCQQRQVKLAKQLVWRSM